MICGFDTINAKLRKKLGKIFIIAEKIIKRYNFLIIECVNCLLVKANRPKLNLNLKLNVNLT